MRSQGRRLKGLALPSRWKAQDRKVRLGQGQQTWENSGDTSGPLQEEEQKFLRKAYYWVKTRVLAPLRGLCAFGDMWEGPPLIPRASEPGPGLLLSRW